VPASARCPPATPRETDDARKRSAVQILTVGLNGRPHHWVCPPACHNAAVLTPRTVRITRYVTPLREGGSLPAIVEADDDGLYVLKFRGAGQGALALIAELVSGELARALGLLVPELVFAELDPDLARTEPDPEIHALIHDSAGLNLALDYLPGSITYDPVLQRTPADLASRIVSRLSRCRRSTPGGRPTLVPPSGG
jgi:hypothetical protein